MKNPNLLGCAVILYAVVLFFYTGSAEGVQVILYMFVAPLLAWLPILLIMSYALGGVGLCFRRRWASLIVLVTAVTQLTLYVGAVAIMSGISGDIWDALWFSSSVAQSLVILVPPGPLAYLSLRLRKDPNAWLSGGQTAEPIRPKWQFYQRKTFWAVMVLGTALVWIGSLRPERRISVEGLRLCYPAEYAVHADFVASLIAQMRGIYADVASEAMYIPDQLLADRIPRFTYDVNDESILYGAVYGRTKFDPIAHAEGVWRIRADKTPHRIERDPTFEGYRVYPWHLADSWHLVLSPPPDVLGPGPPTDWYVGQCFAFARDRCKVYFVYENFVYEHAVQQRNLHLREEIKAAVHDVLEEWGSNCRAPS